MGKWSCLILVGLAAFVACRGKEPAPQALTEAPVVEVVKVERSTVERWTEVPGNVLPQRAIRITPKVPGRIEAIYVKEGDRVKEGQPLVKLDQTDFLIALEKAKSSFQKAKAQLEQARIGLEDRQRDFWRAKALFEQKVISQQEYEKAEVALKASEAQYELAKAQLEEASTALRQAETELRESLIRAPFSGVVTQRFVDPGQRAYTMPPTEILELVDDTKVKVVLDLPERDLPKIRPGAAVKVFPDALPDKEFSGKVSALYPKVDPMTRTFRAEVVLENPKGELKPGMFVKARVFLGREEALLVPKEAVMRMVGTGKEYCFVILKGKAEHREVLTGERFGEKVEVLQGVSEGEEVVVSGQEKLRSGISVRLRGGRG